MHGDLEFDHGREMIRQDFDIFVLRYDRQATHEQRYTGSN
jgi:hypothetical protein